METAGKDKPTILHQRSIPLTSLWSCCFKRAFDVIASILGLIVLAPIFFLPVAILLRREEPGPIFYHGPRAGRGGKLFGILKFRTMYESPESYKGPRVTAKGDDRITPLGKWLRDTKLNELPQLWNVLRGDMSLVGPRPEDPAIVQAWAPEAREEILSIRPGITSPASVLYRDEEGLLPKTGVMDVYVSDILPDKLRLDRLYVRNHSFLGDLDIIFWTLMSLLPRIARQQVLESKLFAGPLYRFVQRDISWFFRDLLIYWLTVGLANLTLRLFGPINWGLGPLSALAFLLAMLFSSVNVFLGLNRIIWARASAAEGMLLVASNGLTTLALLVVNHFYEGQPLISLPALPPELIILMGTFSIVGSLLARYRSRLFTGFANRWLAWRIVRGGLGERVLILGAGEGGQIVHWLLKRGPLRQAFSVIGMVDDDLSKQGMRIDGCPVLGGIRDLPELVRKYDAGILLFTISNISAEARADVLQLCGRLNVRLVFLDDVLESLKTKLI